MKRWSLITLVVIMLAVGAGPAAGQDDPPPLLAMLALIPDTEPVHVHWGGVRYADFQALYIAEGIEELRVTGDTQALLDNTPLPGMLVRIQTRPEAMQFVLRSIERMPEVVGFEWFAAVNRSLEYGTPPNRGLVLGGTFDSAAIGTALSARGFTQTDVNDVPVWHRFEDAQINLQERETADPFGGDIGMAARIAVLPGYLANSHFWQMTEDIIAAAQGEQPSLADDPYYRALAEAITAPEGLLLQAWFLNAADVGFVSENVSAMLAGQTGADPTQDYGPLMPYALAVLADRQEGQDQVHLIGLVYPDTANAQRAAEEIARRISIFSLPSRPDSLLVVQYGAQVSARVYESETTGQAVALVEVRYPLPAERIDPATNIFISGGPIYRLWSQALSMRAFYPLVMTAQ